MKEYVIGVDFGTLSARAILIRAADGHELAQAVCDYPHGVLDKQLPSGKKLPPHYALQHPADYPYALERVTKQVLQESQIDPQQVVGICIDFTTSTVLPIDEQGTPLCMKPGLEDHPQAYVKLWKHHGAQAYADEIAALAARRKEKWFPRYGGNVSSEWHLPKLLEFVREAPELYAQTAHYIEAGNWLTQMLTGQPVYSALYAGYKAFWSEEDGFPDDAFFAELEPRLVGCVDRLLGTPLLSVAKKAGVVNDFGSKLTGLCPGTVVAVPTGDAHAAMPAMNITKPAEMMLILGTSACHIINAKTPIDVAGICGYTKDGILPGLYAYEAGQTCVGDGFDWFVKNCVPASYTAQAQERNINIHALLQEKAEALRPGESGLVALDWFNGNRSILNDSALSSVIVGLTLHTKPEDIYRALLEATAYGTRVIIEQYEAHGIAIDSICAGGGIAQKNTLMMQIYADVTGRTIRVTGSDQSGALGSAIYAAVASGLFPTVEEASARFSRPDHRVYSPIAENQAAYEPLYRRYKTLHDYFGKTDPELLHGLFPNP